MTLANRDKKLEKLLSLKRRFAGASVLNAAHHALHMAVRGIVDGMTPLTTFAGLLSIQIQPHRGRGHVTESSSVRISDSGFQNRCVWYMLLNSSSQPGFNYKRGNVIIPIES